MNIPCSELPVLENILHANNSLWIIKLSTGKRALGIHLVASSEDIPRNRHQYIAQRYVTNPLLIDGRKFHIRLYLVITNLQPLRALLHREGLVLFATKNYSTNLNTFGDFSIHLTNAAVADRTEKKGVRNSILLSELWKRLHDVYKIDTKSIWKGIVDVMTKVVLSEECDRPLEQRTPATCFDVMGVDILLREDFQPVFLECNNGPELHTLTKQVETRKANDQAHRALLKDLIPLATVHSRTTAEDLSTFSERYSSYFP